jgi:sRNA-binding protein
LRKLRTGAHRYGLDGQRCGSVTSDEAAGARQRFELLIERAQRRREGKAREVARVAERAKAEKATRLATSLASLRESGRRRKLEARA